MKILLFSNSSWNLYNFRLGLIKKLIIENHDVYFLGSKCVDSDNLKKENIKMVQFDISQKGKNLFQELLTIYKLFISVKKLRPDYILSYTVKPNIYSLILTYFFKVKIINNITGLGNTFINTNLITYLVFFLYKILLKRSNFVFFQNHDDFDFFTKKKLINKSYSSVIPGSGVNIESFKFSKKNFNDSNNLNFIFCGRTIKEKGIIEFCECSLLINKNYPEISFFVLGFNNYDHLKKYKNIIFLDSNRFDKKKYIDFDCVILPSYREGLPKSLLEFGIQGVPSITTNVPGCNAIIKNGFNGFLCKSKSIDSLYFSIVEFINLPLTSRIKMSYNSRNFVIRNFNENLVIEKYLKILK